MTSAETEIPDCSGADISGPDPADLDPFIDDSVFCFGYGDESAG